MLMSIVFCFLFSFGCIFFSLYASAYFIFFTTAFSEKKTPTATNSLKLEIMSF